jgi:hypothetical protein
MTRLFLYLAGAGYIFSAAIHIIAFYGVAPPAVIVEGVVIFGIFGVCFPTLMGVGKSATPPEELGKKITFRDRIRDCPRWVAGAIIATWAYDLYFTIRHDELTGRRLNLSENPLPPLVVEASTLGAMGLYGLAFGVLYTRLIRNRRRT